MSRAEEIRRELALLAELRELDDEPAAAADEGLELILLELLGEFRKQQVVQGVVDPTLDAEHYALAGVLDRASVEALEAQGWIDPHGREWNLMQQPAPTRVARPKLRPIAEPQLPASLLDQVVVHASEIDLQALVAAEIARLQAPAADDGDIPAELRVNGYPAPSVPVRQALAARPKKPKKAKKKAEPTTLRFADGTPVPPPAPREVPADPLHALTDGDQAFLNGQLEAAEVTAPLQSTPVGWTRGPDGQLIAPPRKAVKAVYPPVRGRGRKPPGLALGGLTTNNEWVRHPASGRMVPPDQVREES